MSCVEGGGSSTYFLKTDGSTDQSFTRRSTSTAERIWEGPLFLSAALSTWDSKGISTSRSLRARVMQARRTPSSYSRFDILGWLCDSVLPSRTSTLHFPHAPLPPQLALMCMPLLIATSRTVSFSPAGKVLSIGRKVILYSLIMKKARSG